MQVEFILERVHKRSFLSMRAYRIVFTDTSIYFLHLGEDASALNMGAAVGGLVGAVGQKIAENRSETKINKRLYEIEHDGLDKAVASDRRSFTCPYTQVEKFESYPQKWNRWPQLVFHIRGRGKMKFTLPLQMENLEEERQAVVSFMREKRPALFPKHV